ncbi:sigma factor [Variovorax paradoxus]|uniref:sigma factor n=1 Tax=Variovorax paradoxus TaxID=34073 RepID=UPI000688D82C|nr:sigma factor [Variovorax paradoxus]
MTTLDAGRSFACVTSAWQAHEAELRGYLRHRLSDADAADDDVLQDVLLKAIRQGPGFCTLENPRAWLFQVARNALVDRLRMARPTEPLSDDLPEVPHEPLAAVDALADCLDRALGELSAGDAAILRACDIEGQTQLAFAQSHSATLASTKSRLQRARQRLRDRIPRACQVRFAPDGSVCCHIPRPDVPT